MEHYFLLRFTLQNPIFKAITKTYTLTKTLALEGLIHSFSQQVNNAHACYLLCCSNSKLRPFCLKQSIKNIILAALVAMNHFEIKKFQSLPRKKSHIPSDFTVTKRVGTFLRGGRWGGGGSLILQMSLRVLQNIWCEGFLITDLKRTKGIFCIQRPLRRYFLQSLNWL